MKPMTISELCAILNDMGTNYTFHGESSAVVTGFSDPGSYRGGTAIWLGAVKYLKLDGGLDFADVTLLFCAPDMEGAQQFPNRIICDDPRNTFMELVEHVAPDSFSDCGIAATAIVSTKAVLGQGVTVGHHAVIEDDVVIGDNSYIGYWTVIKRRTQIGARCVILDHTVIGNAGYGFRKLPDGSHKRLPHLGVVRIGDCVEIGSLCNIDRGTFKDTVIDSGVKIDSTTLIGHNVEIGRDRLIIGGAIGGNCRIGARCEVIGARLKNRLTMGDNVKVGIGSVVLKDLPDEVECFGNPARVIKKT